MALPEIKTDVNKEPERDKKKAGLLGRLFGGGSGGGAMGSGGFGGAAAGGGVLATKAGLLALILVGSTVAGGIGLVGYRLFGPGQDQGNSDNLSVFAPKPKEDPNAAAARGGAGKDGGSSSLQYLSDANKTPAAPDAGSSAAPKDDVAANAAGAKGSASSGPLNAAGDASNGVNKMMKPAAKLGAFGGFGSSTGGGGSSASASAAGVKVPDAGANGRSGNLTAMRHGVAVAGGSSRGIAGRSFKGGIGQALGALADNKGATTSYGAGHTYDGSTAAGGSNIGPDGGLIGAGGAPGTAGGPAQPKSLPNSANDSNTSQPPPTPTSVDAAPWANAIKTAQALIALAVLLLLAASLLSKTAYGHIATMVIAAIVATIGVMVIALGAKIGSGQWGQKLQGGILAAAGVGLEIAAAAALLGGKDAKTTTGGAPPTTTTTPATDGMGANVNGTEQASSGANAGMFSAVNPFVLIGGGLGLMGVVGTMMAPPQKLPTSDYPNGTPPDTHWFGSQVTPSELMPSEVALKKMIA